MNNKELEEVKIPSSIPLLPVRDVVVYPFMILPLYVGRDKSIKAVNEALSQDRLILLSSQKKIEDDNPSPENIHEVGTVAMIMRMRRLPDGRIKILAQGISKAKINKFQSEDPFYKVVISKIEEQTKIPSTPEEEALVLEVKQSLEQVIAFGKVLSPDILMVVDEITDLGRLSDLISSNLGLKVKESQEILETFDPFLRLEKVKEILNKEVEILKMQHNIRNSSNDNNFESRKQFIQDQIKNMRGENNQPNGEDPKAEEIAELRTRIEAANMATHAFKEATKQVNRLEKMHPDASEASIIRSYLDWLCEIPWSVSSTDMLDVTKAKEILDEDHFGLDKVKDRILEFLAVRKLKSDNKGPILCLAGPPGVGKTSLGKSVARAMGREFVRISLGGVHDEAEIRGHRRTYVGSMPGRIIQSLKQAGKNNPILMLDEIDKLGNDYKGDPSSALLEVLDPEQNNTFRDHYLNLDFDLSNVLFICTANVINNIPQALKDRMEVINISGYTQEEKIEITNKYIIKKQVAENGLSKSMIHFSPSGIAKIIKQYTREAGLRNLERLIGSCCRKVAKDVACWDGKLEFPMVKVDSEIVEKFLGPPMYLSDKSKTNNEIGCVTGLAWTQYGGETLEVEVTTMPGKGRIELTGSMGDVMKESAKTSISWIRSKSNELGIAPDYFEKHDLHVHFPNGGIPKDGPSAGITMTTAIVSYLTNIPVKKEVAMTGEISLHGKVLPIGGLKDKILAALRFGIKTVLIPEPNKKDLVEVPENFRKQLKIVSVSHVSEVLELALEKSLIEKKEKSDLKNVRKIAV